MKIIQYYRDILKFAGLTSDEEGNIRKKTKDKSRPLFIQNKPVVLPVYEQLSSAGISEAIVFHPFAESSSKGESIVVNELRQRFCAQLSIATAALMSAFLNVGASKALHKKFNPIQAEMLDTMRKIESKNAAAILTFFTKLLSMKDKREYSFVSIYLCRSGTVAGKDYARAAIVSFPLYDLICEELTKSKDREVAGIAMSEKDLQYVRNLYEYIFPQLKKNKNAYDRGSNSEVAPYMDALMRAAANLEQAINEKVRLFEGTLDEDDLVILPEDWIDAIEDLDNLTKEIILIPLQPGTDGAARLSDTINSQNAMNITQTPNITQQVAQHNAQVAQPAQPVAAPAVNPMGWPMTQPAPQAPTPQQLHPLLNNQPAYGMAPMGYGAPMMQPGMYPQMGMMQPGMMQPGMMPGMVPAGGYAGANLNPYNQNAGATTLMNPADRPLWG